MRSGINIVVTASDRARLDALVAARGLPQKHVWRARIVLLTDDGLGTVAIMAATGKSKTCVWRWQERFMAEGVDGLLRDKTRPPGIAPLAPSLVDRVVALTLETPGHEATHWTARHNQGDRHRRIPGGEDLARSRPGAAPLAQLQAVQRSENHRTTSARLSAF